MSAANVKVYSGIEIHVDFGKSFDSMSLAELQDVAEWYRTHVGGHNVVLASLQPYIDARRRGEAVTWLHKFEQGQYDRKTREDVARLVAKRDARLAAKR